ncbi:glycosyltransferase [Helicobacter turcicus]|uniref:Capsular biosynthesis protein n=1 Tax=Helicobacter turcicus TaxID=2867412 RepID=A0ABS7JM93_9HELI|nr:glycosyltransferase [Helicobacter turcicus]MBX7490510.1 capsular biosynthesis protein [Helicobacter turcicus]MBX7545370.1 capsular biosynthesis protein [Helicobacter turcicus]
MDKNPIELSVIIPFGLSAERLFIQERIIQKALAFKSCQNIEFIFVEGYSSLENDLREIIEKNGHRYLKDKNQVKYFSQGQCRNLGASFARADVLMFLDVDCYVSQASFDKIINLMEIKNIARNLNQFFVLPVIYLTKEGSDFIKHQDKQKWDILIQEDLISGQLNFIQYFSLVSSSIIINRYKFLMLGGNDDTFVGHSYEDHDFFARLLFSAVKFEKMPKNLCFDEGWWNLRTFKGFRAWFSLKGYEMSFYGIYMYHFYHESPNQNGYLSRRQENKGLFYKHLKQLQTHKISPLYTRDFGEKRILLLVSKEKTLLNVIVGVLPYLGHVICAREEEFFSSDTFEEKVFMQYLQENRIDKIFFPNPYGKPKRLEIYNFVKRQNIPFICFDRGALPDSWFFDENGFNWDSITYHEKNWNQPLGDKEIAECKEYIDSILNGEVFLEEQGKRNLTALKEQFTISGKTIVFVPLQVVSDSVVQYFTYEPFSYEGFLDILDNLAEKLKETHLFLLKKHPLTKHLEYQFKNLTLVREDTNIIDLLTISDVVVTLNSGVGVYAMMMRKPCICCANAFYHFCGINYQAKSAEDLLHLLRSDLRVDYDKVILFIHFLRNRFYSYGKSSYKKTYKRGRFYNKVYAIEYYKIRIGLKSYLDLASIDKVEYSLKAMLYKPYIHEIKGGFLVWLFALVMPSYLQAKISHTRLYKLFKKLAYNPRDFFKDSKFFQRWFPKITARI